MENLPNFDIDEVLQAIIADDADLADHQDSLYTALTQLKNGQFGRTSVSKPICKSPWHFGKYSKVMGARSASAQWVGSCVVGFACQTP